MNDRTRHRINVLCPLLKDPVPAVRSAAAEAIEKLEGISATEEILATLHKGSLGERITAIFALGEIGGERVRVPLIYCAGRPEDDIRAAAVEVMGKLAFPEALAIIMERLDDANTAVQARAIAASASFSVTSAHCEKIRCFLDASDGILEAEAALALARLNDAPSLPRIISLLDSPHASSRQAAAQALSLMPIQ